jgi:hypothetical protein
MNLAVLPPLVFTAAFYFTDRGSRRRVATATQAINRDEGTRQNGVNLALSRIR